MTAEAHQSLEQTDDGAPTQENSQTQVESPEAQVSSSDAQVDTVEVAIQKEDADHDETCDDSNILQRMTRAQKKAFRKTQQEKRKKQKAEGTFVQDEKSKAKALQQKEQARRAKREGIRLKHAEYDELVKKFDDTNNTGFGCECEVLGVVGPYCFSVRRGDHTSHGTEAFTGDDIEVDEGNEEDDQAEDVEATQEDGEEVSSSSSNNQKNGVKQPPKGDCGLTTTQSNKSFEKGDFSVVELAEFEFALWHRPAKQSIVKLQEKAGVTHIITLLGKHNESRAIKEIQEECSVREIGWSHIEIGNAQEGTINSEAIWRSAHVSGIKIISQWIADAREAKKKKPTVLIHCAAGLHRTGWFGYAVLRLIGKATPTMALEIIQKTRLATYEQCGKHRLHASECFVKWVTEDSSSDDDVLKTTTHGIPESQMKGGDHVEEP